MIVNRTCVLTTITIIVVVVIITHRTHGSPSSFSYFHVRRFDMFDLIHDRLFVLSLDFILGSGLVTEIVEFLSVLEIEAHCERRVERFDIQRNKVFDMNLSNKLVRREERVIEDLRLRRSGEDSVWIMTIKRVISLVITYEINRMIWSSSENSDTGRIP
jgi:hypothetical protein